MSTEEFLEYRPAEEKRNLEHQKFAGQHITGPNCQCNPQDIPHKEEQSNE